MAPGSVFQLSCALIICSTNCLVFDICFQETSLPRVFKLFRALGLRHLVVVDNENRVSVSLFYCFIVVQLLLLTCSSSLEVHKLVALYWYYTFLLADMRDFCLFVCLIYHCCSVLDISFCMFISSSSTFRLPFRHLTLKMYLLKKQII